jgi:hypothetical protein
MPCRRPFELWSTGRICADGLALLTPADVDAWLLLATDDADDEAELRADDELSIADDSGALPGDIVACDLQLEEAPAGCGPGVWASPCLTDRQLGIESALSTYWNVLCPKMPGGSVSSPSHVEKPAE